MISLIKTMLTNLGVLQKINDVISGVNEHMNNKNNPHQVTAEQLGLAAAYTYQGDVDNFASLPTQGVQKGWVYNIKAEFTLNNEKYPAGTDVAWDGTKWNTLGGSLKGYVRKVNNIAPDSYGNVEIEIPEQVKPDWNASSGSKEEILNKPNLAAVATSGSYNDLVDKPDLTAVENKYNELNTQVEELSKITNNHTNEITSIKNKCNNLSTQVTGLSTTVNNHTSKITAVENKTANITIENGKTVIDGVKVEELSKITFGTNDLTAGTSPLENGVVYLVYE